MRISDWSSDVCSSDLYFRRTTAKARGEYREDVGSAWRFASRHGVDVLIVGTALASAIGVLARNDPERPTGLLLWLEAERKSVVSGQSVSVIVDLGGRRRLHKKIHNIIIEILNY